MKQRQLLHKWNFPHLVHGGITLVAKENAEKCLRMAIEQKCHLHGYDGFTLHSDGRIQPHLEWSASWSWEDLPSLSTMLRDVLDSPAEVTHFEFVFSSDTGACPCDEAFPESAQSPDQEATVLRATTTNIEEAA